MENRKIRVAWVCSFSNEKMRARLTFDSGGCLKILYRLLGVTYGRGTDSAIWNTNAIEEMEKIDDVELHVICPVRGLAKKEVSYEENGIHYYFFREQNSNIVRFVLHQLLSKYTSLYKRNRRVISQLISEIQPDIVHVMGAENPYYSLSLLDVPSNIPTIIQLQALLARLVNVTKVKEEKKSFYYKGLMEREIIKKADYIGTTLDDFKKFIIEEIKSDAQFLDISLAMAQKINLEPSEKQYDFVYFSANISKAGEEALESFILAHKKNPTITLDIVGGYDEAFRARLDARIKECGLENCVTLEGRLPSHDDVIRQIRKARYALLPLKMDFVPNALHEAMANGLPVVTTITDGTPSLNEKRQCVLLSEQNDFHAMADNMISLLDNENLRNELRQNAAEYENERSNNRSIIVKWIEAYKNIVLS